LSAFLTLTVFLIVRSTPIVRKMSSAKVEAATMKAINNSISSVFTEEVSYTDFINILYGDDGDIIALSARTAKINVLSRQMAAVTEKNIESIGDNGISIPIGAFSGIELLSGTGPSIKVRFVQIGAVNCDFISEFRTMGINQTLHKIYMNLYADVQIVLPTAVDTLHVSAQVLISESVIVGKIPSTYLQASELNDMMDLIPG